MLTVMMGRELSGNNKTRRPFCSLYSVIPSIDVTFSTPAGGRGGFATSAACVSIRGSAEVMRQDTTRRNRLVFMGAIFATRSNSVQLTVCAGFFGKPDERDSNRLHRSHRSPARAS